MRVFSAGLGNVDPNLTVVEAVARTLHNLRPDVPSETCRKQAELVVGEFTDRNNPEHMKHSVDVSRRRPVLQLAVCWFAGV